MTNIRDIVMSKRYVLCTGNPDKNTIASGIRQVFPNTTFIHKSNGYNLEDMSEQDILQVKECMKKHNCFINASYISPNTQLTLLNLYFESVKMGEVFNVGSTHEYDNLGGEEYKKSKLTLRNRSLELNNYRINTTHVIVGTINLITPVCIANIILWITQQDIKIPIIGIDQEKGAW